MRNWQAQLRGGARIGKRANCHLKLFARILVREQNGSEGVVE